MADTNKMFTTRSGKQVPVPVVTIPPDVVTTVMRMQEDYAVKGQKYSLAGLVLYLISTGKTALDRRAVSAAKNKDNRDTGKAVKEYIRVQLLLRKPIDPSVIAELSGLQIPTDAPEEFSDTEETELTDDQLDAATQPGIQ